MICVLYRSSLVMAYTSASPKKYQIFTVIPLINATIEEADNGRGLQCHTAQFTWKLVFEIDHRQQELLLSACSEVEEHCWRSQIEDRTQAENMEHAEGREKFEILSMMNGSIKSLGMSFGSFTNFSRRLSIQRSATVGSKSNLQQLIIKNTECPKFVNSSANAISVVRSQSHLSSGHIPILAPRRQDRIKLEIAISDIWTKSLLPYPGMNTNRMESTIRASANHVMRKLSIASMTSMSSIASTFSKRSMSYSGSAIQRPSTVGNNSRISSSSQSTRTIRGKHTAEKREPVLVDFHSTPKAFLPEDFELDIKPRRAKKLSARLSMMIETESSESSSIRATSTVRRVDKNQPQAQSQLPDFSTESTIRNVSFCHDPVSEERLKVSVNPVMEPMNKDNKNNSVIDQISGENQGYRRLARTRRVLMRLFT
jgi:hypothetical protein